MEKKAILVVGSTALDTVESPAGRVEDALGGSCFYFATAACMMAPVRIVGVVGTDFPLEKIEFLKDKDVDMDGLAVMDGRTFRWGGRYHEDPNLRDTLFTELGVFESFRPEIPQHFRGSPLVFLGNIHPALQNRVLDQINNPEIVILDTMNLWIRTTPKELERVISRVDVLIVNDEEARDLTGKQDLLSAADELFARGLKSVVIKKGQHGAILFHREGGIFCAPAFPLRSVVDPTGAGDTFAGGFMGYLASHDLSDPMIWRRAVVQGSVIASFVVEDFSMNRTRVLTMDEVEERVGSFRDMVAF